MSDIKAYFRREERYEGLQVAFNKKTSNREEILKTIEGLQEEMGLKPDIFENCYENDPDRCAFYIEFSDEVRKLAERTDKAVSEIQIVIKAMQQEVTQAGEKSEEIARYVDEGVQAIAVFHKSFSEDAGLMEHTFNDISHTADRIFMTLAKLDHVLWKINTYLSASCGEEKFAFVDHHNCRLGKWYYEGEGKEYFSHKSEYHRLEEPHSVVHNGTKKIFELIKKEELDFDELLRAFDEMERGSGIVFEILDSLLDS